MRIYLKRLVSHISAAAIVAAASFVIGSTAQAGQYIDGHYVYADQYGNLIIQKPGGYKQIIVGEGDSLKNYKPEKAEPAPRRKRGPRYYYRDPGDYFEDREFDEYGYLDDPSSYHRITPENSNATCVNNAVVLRGRSYMYGIGRNEVALIDGVC